MSDMNTANPRIPSPLTAGILPRLAQELPVNESERCVRTLGRSFPSNLRRFRDRAPTQIYCNWYLFRSLKTPPWRNGGDRPVARSAPSVLYVFYNRKTNSLLSFFFFPSLSPPGRETECGRTWRWAESRGIKFSRRGGTDEARIESRGGGGGREEDGDGDGGGGGGESARGVVGNRRAWPAPDPDGDELTAARTIPSRLARRGWRGEGVRVRVRGRRAGPADEGGRRSRDVSIEERCGERPRRKERTVGRCTLVAEAVWRARRAPPGFQGRREYARGRGVGRVRWGYVPIWALGAAFAHGSLTGRTVGVELVASPCQRLRGCRHLQPSTGPVRRTSDTAARRNASAHARSTLARGISYFERRGAARRGVARQRSSAIDRRAKGHRRLERAHGLSDLHSSVAPRLNAKGCRDRMRGLASTRFARMTIFSLSDQRARVHRRGRKRVRFGWKYKRCFFLFQIFSRYG